MLGISRLTKTMLWPVRSCSRSDGEKVQTLSRVPAHVHPETASGRWPRPFLLLLLLCLVSIQLMVPAEALRSFYLL